MLPVFHHRFARTGDCDYQRVVRYGCSAQAHTRDRIAVDATEKVQIALKITDYDRV